MKERLVSIDKEVLSDAVFKAAKKESHSEGFTIDDLHSAVPVHVSKKAFDLLIKNWEAVSDDHRIQLLLQSLE